MDGLCGQVGGIKHGGRIFLPSVRCAKVTVSDGALGSLMEQMVRGMERMKEYRRPFGGKKRPLVDADYNS